MKKIIICGHYFVSKITNLPVIIYTILIYLQLFEIRIIVGIIWKVLRNFL